MSKRRSIRILQVVFVMNWGGIETWLIEILRHIDRDRFHIDFLVHTIEPCPYDEQVRLLGSQIISCLHPREYVSQPWLYARKFKQILRKYGPYDVVHSHTGDFNGYILRLAQQVGVPVRIAHSHLDASLLEFKTGWHWYLYFALMLRWINQYATLGWGCSRKAAAALFGLNWEADPRWQVLYCGIDLTQFRDPVDPLAVRAELGIPADAFVIGHVGRFYPQKNHVFLVDIAAEVAKQEPNMRLLLVGEGLLRPDIEQKVAQLGLADRVIFAGIRSDVPRLMLGAMNLLLLPSLHEGLPLVVMETQAAGLPCICSNAVPDEADVVKPLVRRLSLSQSASEWAEELLSQRNANIITQSDALSLMEISPFNIEISVKQYVTKIKEILD